MTSGSVEGGTCTYIWTGDAWELDQSACDEGYVCVPPPDPGNDVGDVVAVPPVRMSSL